VLALAPACSPQGKARGGTGPSTTTVTGDTATSSSATVTGTGGQAGEPPAMPCAPAQVETAAAGAGAFTVKTAHYELYAETTQDRAAEMGRLLDAAFPAFQAWFKATPPLAGGALQVKLYASEARWAAALAADGIAVPEETAGYFSPTTRTAYLFDQPNPYYT